MENYEYKISIKSWAEEDRPREKLINSGRRVLSDAELIAILIGSGTANESAVELSKRILHHFSGDLNLLGKASVKDLCKFKGIGEAKAISIIAALELGRRRKEAEQKPRVKISSSSDAFNLMQRYFADLNHEEFWIILVNRGHSVLSTHLISKGGQAGTIADPKIIFQTALENHAASIVLAHNHPSGTLKASHADISLTKKMQSCGAFLDIAILDHLIFNDTHYLSFADEGIL